MLPAAEGTMLATIILSSAVLYELTGPACAKLALLRSGAIPHPATRQPARGHGRMPSMPDTGDTQEPPARRDKNAAPPQKHKNPFVIRFLLLYRRVIRRCLGSAPSSARLERSGLHW